MNKTYEQVISSPYYLENIECELVYSTENDFLGEKQLLMKKNIILKNVSIVVDMHHYEPTSFDVKFYLRDNPDFLKKVDLKQYLSHGNSLGSGYLYIKTDSLINKRIDDILINKWIPISICIELYSELHDKFHDCGITDLKIFKDNLDSLEEYDKHDFFKNKGIKERLDYFKKLEEEFYIYIMSLFPFKIPLHLSERIDTFEECPFCKEEFMSRDIFYKEDLKYQLCLKCGNYIYEYKEVNR